MPLIRLKNILSTCTRIAQKLYIRLGSVARRLGRRLFTLVGMKKANENSLPPLKVNIQNNDPFKERWPTNGHSGGSGD